MKQGHVMELEVFEFKNVLGEAPVWNPRAQKLTWVDCVQKQLFQRDPLSGQLQEFALPHYPGSYAYGAKSDNLLMAYRNKLAILQLQSGAHRVIDTPFIDFSATRFSD